jgi:hypothetical protein
MRHTEHSTTDQLTALAQNQAVRGGSRATYGARVFLWEDRSIPSNLDSARSSASQSWESNGVNVNRKKNHVNFCSPCSSSGN